MTGRSVMWKYIAQEPECVRKLLNSGQFSETVGKLGSFRKICFVAHGSSYNAAITVQSFFAENSGITALVHTPQDMKTNNALLLKDKEILFVGVSQTGTSRGVLEVLRMAKENGRKTLAVTNVQGSPLERLSAHTIFLLCGEEKSNAKTKGYTNTLTALLLLAVAIGQRNGVLSSERAAAIRKEIADSLLLFADVKEQAVAELKKHRYGEKMEVLYVLGDGMNSGTAMEGQLKMMETQCIPTAFSDTGEFSHGMHRSISGRIHSILIDVADTGEHIDAIRAFLQRNGNQNILITTNYTRQKGLVLAIPLFPLTQSVLLTTLLIQIISVFVPELNGGNPNRYRHDAFTHSVQTRLSD